MQESEITAGSTVIITDAYGNEIKARALSGVEVEGRDGFPVIRVERPLKDGRYRELPLAHFRLCGRLDASRPANDPGPA
jgi:hypothetical protein